MKENYLEPSEPLVSF